MKKRTWKQVILSIPESHHELLTGSLAALGFGGFLQEEAHLTGFIPSRAWTHAVEVRFRNLLSRFRKEFPQLEGRYMLRTVREKNWNAAWERSAGIVEATGRIVIKPSWKKLRASDKKKIVLHIDPKMAFGTGHHETTRLSLTLLERCCNHGARVLDVGTGTGILAIAAVKLGAHSAIGIDIDEWSIANAKENVYRNHTERAVTVRKGDVSSLPDNKFDVVVANIDYQTIVKNLAKLIRPVKHGGTLILSGLLTQDLNPLLDALKHQSVVPVEVLSENEWAALALIKSDGK